MASRKLTSLPTLTDVALNDKVYIVDVSDTSESPQGTSKQTTVANILPTLTSTDGSIDIDLTDPSAPDLSVGYRSYVALLTQTGTSAPTATVLKNNTGIVFTPSYDDVGEYSLIPSVLPDPNKVTAIGANTSNTGYIQGPFWRAGVVKISTVTFGNDPVNGVLNNSTIEIRIYS